MKASTKERLLLILGCLFLIVLFGLLVFDLFRRGIYNGKLGINIAVIGDNGVSVLLIRPDEEMAGWVKLPKNIKVKVYNSDARYPLESMWRYGVSEKRPYEIIEKSLGQSMGIVISRTIKLDSDLYIENVMSQLLRIGLKTDLSFKDRVSIRNFLSDAVKFKKVLELSVPSSVFDKVTDPDGKEFYEFNSSISLWTKNKFVIEAILNENADVSINNISGVAGAGNVLSSQLESVGMHVIEVKADMEEMVDEKGCVFSSKKYFEMAESVLKNQVGCRNVSKSVLSGDDEVVRVWIK